MSKAIRVALAAALSLVAFIACGSDETSPASSGTYAIIFPSLDVVIASETVQVLVFDAALPSTDCLSLLSKRKSKQPLPTAPALIFETEPVTVCELFAQTAGASGTLSIGHGARSFVAIVQRGGEDFFLGCGSTSISEANNVVQITLAAANTQIRVPSTTCMALSQKCSGGC